MKLFKCLFVVIIICLSIISCDKEDNYIEVKGTIQKQGFTLYMYGTHTISTDPVGPINYAARSSNVNLDDYLNQNVIIVGYKIDGYPIDFGPDYIEVVEVK